MNSLDNSPVTTERSWWHRQNRPYEKAELIADAVVHCVGLVIAMGGGALLLGFAWSQTALEHVPTLLVYLGSLVVLLSVSLAFNLWPVTPVKMHLARLDQASIFIFLAGSYTPFLAAMNGSPMTTAMSVVIWGLSLLGVALKLLVPHRFGRVAILLYLALGWSGLLVFKDLAAAVTPATLWLLVAGGIVYSLGLIFHLWEQLRFQNALWHVAVVVGATLHLAAVFNAVGAGT